jgi:hypothetical protein
VKLNGRREYKMQSVIYALDKNGVRVGANPLRIDGLLSDEEFNRVVKEGIIFSAKVPLHKDQRLFKIVIYDEKSGRIGSRYLKNVGNTFVFDKRPRFDANHRIAP